MTKGTTPNLRIAKCILIISVFILSITISYAQAIKFNGTSSYINLGNGADLHLTNFTIEAWIKIEGTGVVTSTGSGGLSNVIPIISKGRAQSEAAAVDVNYIVGYDLTTFRLVADFEDNATSGNHPVTGTNAIPACAWTHIAVTYNASLSEWRLYINGNLDKTLDFSAAATTPQSLSNVNALIGSTHNGSNINEGYFNGKIDEVRIWNNVRTDAEILSNYNLEILSPPAALKGRWALNENTGTTANNSGSGTGINGSLLNTTWNSTGFANEKTSLDFDGNNDYVSFGSASPALNATSFTLEAWIRIEGTGATTTTSAADGGGFEGPTAVVPIVAKGRGEGESPANINTNYFMGLVNNKLAADFEEGASGLNHSVIGNATIPMNTWTHVACTYNASTGVWNLYINGVLDKTLTLSASFQPANTSIQHASVGSALTSGGTAAGFFNGKIDEVRIWNLARSAAEISAGYTMEISSGSGLLGRWSFNDNCGTTALNTGSASAINGTLTNGPIWSASNYNAAPQQPTNLSPANGQSSFAGNQVSMNVTDPEGKPMTVKLYGRPKSSAAALPNFTIIGLPDTQFYTQEPQGTGGAGGGHNAIFKMQTQWIKDRRIDSNIAFVIQLGDCTQNGQLNEIEWKRADTAMKTIENPSVPIPDGIPYSICVGNHDQGNGVGDPFASTDFYNQYFGSNRFSTRSYYGGFQGTKYDNHYELFSASGIDFIHISIEYNSNSGAANQAELQSVLNWADGLLKTHSNRKGIISSHWFMGTGIGGPFQGPGQKVYDELKDNPNLIFMLCGHVSGEGRRTDVFNGSTLHTVLSDYQSMANGGDGYLRIMQFRPSENVVTFRTYSPFINAGAGGFRTGADSEFSLPVQLTQPFVLLGTNSGVASGSSTNFLWNGLNPGTAYEWYVTIDDGEILSTSSIFEFTTAGTVPLKLLNFKAVPDKDRVKINWTTTDEVNTKSFDVERSLSGNAFSLVANLKAKNSSGIHHYELFDDKPLDGKSFYRLRMIDIDGKQTYSKVIPVDRSRNSVLEIIPNPIFGKEIRVLWQPDVAQQVTIRISDMSGRLYMKKIFFTNGQTLVLPHQLMPGIYNLEIISKDIKLQKQIVIR